MNILTINLALSTLVFWIAAKIYVLPKLQDYEARAILLPILLAPLLAAPRLDVSHIGSHLSWHSGTVYPPGSLRRSCYSHPGNDHHSSSRDTGAEREIVGVAL